MSVTVLGSYVNANFLFSEHLPQVGESLTAQRLWTEHGGKGLNLAVGMHRLGCNVHTIMAIGQDTQGQSLLEYLNQEHLPTQWIKISPERSGFGVGLIDPNGNNMIVVYPGANYALTPVDIEGAQNIIRESKLVCAQFEILDAPIITAFKIAKAHHIYTLLNPSPWRAITPELLQVTDILVLNETEAAYFFGLDPQERLAVEAWQQLLANYQWHGALLIVTLAELGCIALCQEVNYRTAWVVTQVDATGAGDAFTAGLVRAVAIGLTWVQALTFANACGAMVAMQAGVLTALPTEPQVQAFMQANYLA